MDLIKIDTDGHEYSVLEGARRSVPRYLPAIIFELGLYLMEERGVSFEAFDQYFSSLGYRLLNSRNGRPIHQANYLKEVPLRSTIDVVALPPTRTMTPRVGLRDGVWCFRRTIDK